MLITRTNPITGKRIVTDLPITEEQYVLWKSGTLIQNAMPNLSADDREWLISGITPEQWNRLWSYDDEDEEESSNLIDQGFLPPMNELEFQNHLAETAPPKEPKQAPPLSHKIYSTKLIYNNKFQQIRPILPYLSDDVILGGGALRTLLTCAHEEVCDFDLFFTSFQGVFDLREKIKAAGYAEIFACPEEKLFTYKKGKHKIQLICEQEFSSPQELIESFDVSACGFSFHKGEFFFRRSSVRSVFNKKLRVHNVTFPVATIKRLVKYANKGYNINNAARDFVELMEGKLFSNEDLRVYID